MSRPDRVAVIVFPNVTIHVPSVGEVPYIGHAAVLLVRGDDGLTKYYEFGRYPNPPQPQEDGVVRNCVVPDIAIDANGELDQESLRATYRKISTQSGKSTDIKSVMFPAAGQFDAGMTWCEARLALNADATRSKYSPLTNNCCHFAASAASQMVNVAMKAVLAVIDPIPHGYITTLQLLSVPLPNVHNIDYDYGRDTLS